MTVHILMLQATPTSPSICCGLVCKSIIVFANYADGAVKFLCRMANELSLPFECVEVSKKACSVL